MRPADEVIGWFRGRIPVEWFTDPVDVDADREEILLTGRVTEPPTGDAESPEARGAACLARVKGFREDTREHRVRIASEAEAKFGKKVSWATRCGDVEAMFTNASVPVMTRLRMPERAVLDTLIDAGVARSRSEALAWCVRLVGRHQSDWIGQLRDAMQHVEQVRAEGPEV
jgi:hypothetical protein